MPALAAEVLLRVLLGVLPGPEPADRADEGAGEACSSLLVRSATCPSSASFSDSRPCISACTAPTHAEVQQERSERTTGRRAAEWLVDDRETHVLKVG